MIIDHEGRNPSRTRLNNNTQNTDISTITNLLDLSTDFLPVSTEQIEQHLGSTTYDGSSVPTENALKELFLDTAKKFQFLYTSFIKPLMNDVIHTKDHINQITKALQIGNNNWQNIQNNIEKNDTEIWKKIMDKEQLLESSSKKLEEVKKRSE